MNETVKILKGHATVRRFVPDYIISEAIQKEIIAAAKQAPSWMNGQAYSVIVFQTDAEKAALVETVKKDQVNLSNGSMIEEASLFLLFCMDLSLYSVAGDDISFKDEIEPVIISTMDATLALENALIAAESFELGTCVIGGIRRSSKEIIETLQIPQHVFPLVGLAIGKPTQPKNQPKPRLPHQTNIFLAKDYPVRAQVENVEKYVEDLQVYAENTGYTSDPWLNRFVSFYQDKGYSTKTLATLQKQKLI